MLASSSASLWEHAYEVLGLILIWPQNAVPLQKSELEFSRTQLTTGSIPNELTNVSFMPLLPLCARGNEWGVVFPKVIRGVQDHMTSVRKQQEDNLPASCAVR